MIPKFLICEWHGCEQIMRPGYRFCEQHVEIVQLEFMVYGNLYFVTKADGVWMFHDLESAQKELQAE